MRTAIGFLLLACSLGVAAEKDKGLRHRVDALEARVSKLDSDRSPGHPHVVDANGAVLGPVGDDFSRGETNVWYSVGSGRYTELNIVWSGDTAFFYGSSVLVYGSSDCTGAAYVLGEPESKLIDYVPSGIDASGDFYAGFGSPQSVAVNSAVRASKQCEAFPGVVERVTPATLIFGAADFVSPFRIVF